MKELAVSAQETCTTYAGRKEKHLCGQVTKDIYRKDKEEPGTNSKNEEGINLQRKTCRWLVNGL